MSDYQNIMSHKNEYLNKKTKKEVNDPTNHQQVQNVPIFFTDYGSQCSNKYESLAYLRAPEWQINLAENKQLYEEVNRQMKSNISTFELLPNELIQDLFEYLPLIDLFRSFYYLNQRFRQLVQYQLHTQAHLRIDFSGLSLREFDFMCNQLDPKRIEALTLGDYDLNRANEICSFGQIALFLHRYHLSQFTSLKSLRIIEPCDNNQLILLLNQLPKNQLKHLWIRFGKYSERDLLFCLPFIDTIESMSLDQMIVDDLPKHSQMNFQQLQYLSIRKISTTFLFTLLPQMSRLRYLSVKLTWAYTNEVDIVDLSNNKFALLYLTTLYVEWDTVWDDIELHLLGHMPNLHRLSLVGDYKTPVSVLAQRWKECFPTFIPQLIDFRFYVHITLTNGLLSIDEALKPFHEEFWQERKCYVAVDKREEMNAYLYSLPCPRFYWPLQIIHHEEHQLTTLPASCEINHTYYDSTTFLDVSYINKDFQTNSIPILYWNIRSLIINRSDCDMLLHRLILLSSVRELTLVNHTNPISFINLLSVMTRLESVRLLEGSEKILLLLDENTSLMECLQKRAIRKLFLQNHYSIKDITNKTPFPLVKFIQVFGNSLECLHWIQPPASIPVYFLINGLPKLKSLTIVWRPKIEFSTYKLIEWIQENTRLNTFLIKCETIGAALFWHFWL